MVVAIILVAQRFGVEGEGWTGVGGGGGYFDAIMKLQTYMG